MSFSISPLPPGPANCGATLVKTGSIFAGTHTNSLSMGKRIDWKGLVCQVPCAFEGRGQRILSILPSVLENENSYLFLSFYIIFSFAHLSFGKKIYHLLGGGSLVCSQLTFSSCLLLSYHSTSSRKGSMSTLTFKYTFLKPISSSESLISVPFLTFGGALKENSLSD